MLPDPPAATVLYASLDLREAEAQRFEAAICELPEWLAREPLCAPVSVAPMPAAWLNAFQEAFSEAPNITEAVIELSDTVMEGRTVSPRLVLGCTPDHQFAQNVVRQYPDHKWGASSSFVALCYYCENPYIVWHETAHTLTANECYDPVTKQTTCECPGCLMQYAPAEDTIGDWPWLCEANQELIRSFAGRFVAANKEGDATGG